MSPAEGLNVRVVKGLRVYFKQPSGPSRQGTEWAVSLSNSSGEQQILVRTYADEVGNISSEQEAQLAIDYIMQLLNSGWSPSQYKGTPGELIVPAPNSRGREPKG